MVIRDSWNTVYFLLAKAVVQASKHKWNFLTRWKTFHFQTSTIQQWTTEGKEPIHNSNKKTKLLEILRGEFSSKSALTENLMLHQNLHHIPPQSIQRHFYWQNKLCKCYPHVRDSTLEFLPEGDSTYEAPASTEVTIEKATLHGVLWQKWKYSKE